MALPSSLYKTQIALSDVDRGIYEDLAMTVALHPSETVERMMVRILVFCLTYTPELTFTKGLSTNEEPDLWEISLDNRIQHWIEVGQPDPARTRKGVSRGERVSVYAYGRSDVWWQKHADDFRALPKVSVFCFDAEETQALVAMDQRQLKLEVTISDGLLYVTSGDVMCQCAVSILHQADGA